MQNTQWLSNLSQSGVGQAEFLRKDPKAHPFIVGHSGMSLEDFFTTDPTAIFG
jgi:hypothetical protein